MQAKHEFYLHFVFSGQSDTGRQSKQSAPLFTDNHRKAILTTTLAEPLENAFMVVVGK